MRKFGFRHFVTKGHFCCSDARIFSSGVLFGGLFAYSGMQMLVGYVCKYHRHKIACMKKHVLPTICIITAIPTSFYSLLGV